MLTIAHVTLWIAVAINLGAGANYLYWSVRYRRKIAELETMCHDVQNLHSVMAEHIPVERLRPPRN